MWDVKQARKLIAQAKKSDSKLAGELGKYLSYAIDTIAYYKNRLNEKKK